LAALCSNIGGLLSALCSCAALFSISFTAAVMTACYVLAQRAFRHDGRFARVGVKAFAFTWTSVALLTLATLGFCLSMSKKKQDRYGEAPRRGSAGGMGMGSRMFRKKQARQSKMTDGSSTYDNESQSRMNKEYDLNAPVNTV